MNFCAMNRQLRKWLLAVLGFIVVLYLGVLDRLVCVMRDHTLLPVGFTRELIVSALSTDAIVSFIPVLAVIPFSGTFIEEIKSNFARYLLIRSGYCHYLLGKILMCYLYGGTVLLFGCISAWGIAALVFLPIEKVAEDGFSHTEQVFSLLLIFFQAGGFWAVVGMSMSTIMESKYIAYASPFVIYYLLVILCERYFPEAFLLYPPNWTNPEVWPYGAWGAAILLIELTLVFSILFVFRAGRRLREL